MNQELLVLPALPIPARIPWHNQRRITAASCCGAWAARSEKQQQMGAGELAGSIQQASAESKPSSLASCSSTLQQTSPTHASTARSVANPRGGRPCSPAPPRALCSVAHSRTRTPACARTHMHPCHGYKAAGSTWPPFAACQQQKL